MSNWFVYIKSDYVKDGFYLQNLTREEALAKAKEIGFNEARDDLYCPLYDKIMHSEITADDEEDIILMEVTSHEGLLTPELAESFRVEEEARLTEIRKREKEQAKKLRADLYSRLKKEFEG